MLQRNRTRLISLLLFLLSAPILRAQEVNLQVEVLGPSVQLTTKDAIFKALKSSIENFVNGRRWTTHQFKQEERVEISMVFTIDNMPSQTSFKGSLQLVSSRPIFNSSYNSTMLRVKDDNIDFSYQEFQPLEFVEGAFTDNLTAILAFYVYMCLGIDYDSFSPMGGTTYYTKALDIANGAQTSGSSGWSATDKGRDNRYWLVFQMMDERFKSLREAYYSYHRLGMDSFTEDVEQGRAIVLKSLESLMEVHRNSPNSYLLQVFLESKRQEIISIFSKATTIEKNKLIKLMETIDIANSSKYRTSLMN